MSKTTTIKTSFTDEEAIKEVCKSMGLPASVKGTAGLYDRSTHTGTIIKLPGWIYPVIITKDGKAHFDNYNGHWGDQKVLDQFRQTYSKVRVMKEFKKAGYTVQSQTAKAGKLVMNFAKY